MSSSETPSKTSPVNYPDFTKTPTYNKFFKDMLDMNNRLLSTPTQGHDAERKDIMGTMTRITTEYMDCLIQDFVEWNRPEIPVIPWLELEPKTIAQEILSQKLKEKNGGITPPSPNIFPEDSSLERFREGRRKWEEEQHGNLNNPYKLELAYCSGVDRQYRYAKKGQQGPWIYEFRCGPKLCRTRGVEDCGHGVVRQDGTIPIGWVDFKGFEAGNPYLGIFDGPEEFPAQDPSYGMRTDEMDIDG